MKIVDVKSVLVSIPLEKPKLISTRSIHSREYTVVKVLTDEGIVGIGYTMGACASIVEKNLRGLLIDEDPFCVEKLWNKMFYGNLRAGRKGEVIRAISAVDIALWDIMGKAVDKPLYKLLGGYRDKVPVYASGGYYQESKGIDGLVKEMTSYVEQGFKAVKMKIGRLSIKEDVERVKAVREAIGDDIQLMVDANNAWDILTAIRIGKELEKYSIFWLEEPVMPDNLHANRKVADALDVPIASGEIEYTRWGFHTLIENRAVDIIQPNAFVCGGISEWIKISALASAWDVPVAPHNAQDIHVHLAAATSNSLNVEYFLPSEDIIKFSELLIEPNKPKDGYMEVPQKPGLGIDLNEKAIERYKIA